jgi:hypothetical protein
MSRTKSPPPKDPRLDVPLGIEHLRGRGFYRTLFRERVFYDTSDWCKVCGRGISQRPYPGKHYVRGCYVTLRVIAYPDGSEWKQWEWVCRVCFKRFGELCGWTVLAGEPAPIRDFELHPAEPEVLPPEQCQEIAVNYTLQSIQGTARLLGIRWTRRQTEKFIGRHRRRLEYRLLAQMDMELRRALLSEGAKRS